MRVLVCLNVFQLRVFCSTHALDQHAAFLHFKENRPTYVNAAAVVIACAERRLFAAAAAAAAAAEDDVDEVRRAAAAARSPAT